MLIAGAGAWAKRAGGRAGGRGGGGGGGGGGARQGQGYTMFRSSRTVNSRVH